MGGGAIIPDFIPAGRHRRLTADILWPDLKKSPGKHSKGWAESEAADDGFKAGFQDSKDEPDVEDYLDDGVNTNVAPFALKPFSFSTAAASKTQ